MEVPLEEGAFKALLRDRYKSLKESSMKWA